MMKIVMVKITFFYDDINSDVEDDEMNFIYFDSDSEGSCDSCSDYED